MLSKANASSANKEHATRPTVRLVGAECSADESERWKKLKTSSFGKSLAGSQLVHVQVGGTRGDAPCPVSIDTSTAVVLSRPPVEVGPATVHVVSASAVARLGCFGTVDLNLLMSPT